MEIKVFARVGCTFNLNCEPNRESIMEALKEQLKTIQYADGETYIPIDEGCITDYEGNEIEDLDPEEFDEEWSIEL